MTQTDSASLGRSGAPMVERIGRRLIDVGLGQGDSLLTPGCPVWKVENLDELKHQFVDRPDMGADDFFEKLDQQLADVSSGAIQLFAELFILNLLPLFDYRGETKIDRIERVLAKCPTPVTIPDDVREAMYGRVFRGGRAFMSRRWAQIGFLIEFTRYFRSRPEAERYGALNNPLAFRDLVQSAPGPREPAQRQSLLYLAFPGYFLPIVNGDHRRAIRDALAATYLEHALSDVDEDLNEINENVVAEQGEPVDYYLSPWKERWQPPKEPVPGAEPTDQVRHAWKVHGSNVKGQDMMPIWRTKGTASLAASLLRPVEPDVTRDELKAYVEEDYRSSGYAARQEKLDDFYAFLARIHAGDLVVTVSEQKLYFGTITGDASFVKGGDGRSNLRRPVQWQPHSVPWSEVPAEIAARLNAQGEVVDLSQHVDQLLALAGQRPIGRLADALHLPDASAELAERLHVPQDWLQECVDLLRDRPQLIFYGPPGTGKTYIAKELAHHLAGAGNVKLVQFHPGYSYEDFFEGYRPVSTGVGQVAFELKPGPLRKLVDRALENPDAAYVLIIDEINRGNLAKIFGELYFLLEYRNESIDLLYSGDDTKPFVLPKNVVIVGTMNTADRSIALVDAAMRRRFAFLALHPSEPPTSGILRSWLKSNNHPLDVADLLDELNARIVDPDFKIGPSYFMRPAVFERAGLRRAWRTAILPLLEEHHYGDKVDVAATYGLEAIRKRMQAKAARADPDSDDAAPADAD